MSRTIVTIESNPRNIVTKSANYTATWDDDHIQVSAAATITLPLLTAMASNGRGGKAYKIERTGTGVVSVAPASGDTVAGLSGGLSLNNANDVVLLEARSVTRDWAVIWPELPQLGVARFGSVVKSTAGTTAQNVFGVGGAPCALTITAVLAIAKDINAGNMILKNGTNTVASFAKSTTAGVVTGEDGTLASMAVAKGAVCTVESSTTNGDGVVIVCFEVQG